MTPLQQSLVMGFGALVVVASVALLFFRSDVGNSRIKIVGQEFEISTPALVVFLAGCGIFVLPFFVPIQIVPQHSERYQTVVQPLPRTPSSTAAKQELPGSQDGAPKESRMADGQEIEPNDHISQANLVQIGSTTNGRIDGCEQDWFKFISDRDEEIYILYRHLQRRQLTDIAALTLFDSRETEIYRDSSDGRNIGYSLKVKSGLAYYVRIGAGASCNDSTEIAYDLVIQ
jgi:hypothetical protein